MSRRVWAGNCVRVCEFWRQIPCVAQVACGCGCKCLSLRGSMSLTPSFSFFNLWFCRSLSHFFSRLLGGASLSFSLSIACALFCLSLCCSLSKSVSPRLVCWCLCFFLGFPSDGFVFGWQKVQRCAFPQGKMGTERERNPWGLWTDLCEREWKWESSYEKNLPTSAGNFFWSIVSESEKVFARILDEFFRCLDLPKIIFLVDEQFKIWWPWPLPLYFEIEHLFYFLTKSVLDGDSQHQGIQT